jgi:diguanylate cyclase (GGDEF)-like protein/PAS domain S-box-containing protein
MWMLDATTFRFLAVNDAATGQYGYSNEEFLRMSISDIWPDARILDVAENVAKSCSGTHSPGVRKHRGKDGATIDVEIVCHDLEFQGSKAILCAAYDVTDRHRSRQKLRASEKKYRALFEHSADACWLMDENGFVDCNSAALEMFGFSEKADFTDPAAISPSTQPDGTPSWIAVAQRIASAKLKGSERFEWLHKRSNGEVFPTEVSLSSLKLNKKQMLLASVRDITERKATEAQAEFLAYHDALTGLPNRALLKDRLKNSLDKAQSNQEKVAVLFLDLDRFKTINDSLGQAMGDQLLKDVAERLSVRVRNSDTVSRFGGDEFVVVLTDIKETTDVKGVAERIVNAVTKPFSIAGHSINLGGSLGISMYPEDSENGETLVAFANQAMCHAKKTGRNAFRFFTNDLNVAAVERLKIENQLRQALRKREFYLEYQPQMELSSGRIIGMEALLRWNNQELGLVPPSEFIAIAESSGLILPLGRWVLENACAQIRKWQDEGLNVYPVAVNISAVQFGQQGFADQVCEILAETGLSAEFLELELTEGVLLANADVMGSILTELIVTGVSLAIDDFGMG